MADLSALPSAARSARPSPGARRPLVLGWGSLLHGDDGAGPRVVEAVAQLAGKRVDCLAELQLLPEFAPRIALAAAVVFIDATAGDRPGLTSWEALSPRSSATANETALSHEVSPQLLLDLAAALYGRAPPAALITLSGACFALGDELSPQLAAAIAPAAQAIVAWLDEQASRAPG